MAFGFSNSPWQAGSTSRPSGTWNAGAQSPWRHDPTTMPNLLSGVSPSPAYMAPEAGFGFPQMPEETAPQSAMTFGGMGYPGFGFGGAPAPMPMPVQQPARAPMEFVMVDGKPTPLRQAFGGAFAPMQLAGGVTAYGNILSTGQGLGRVSYSGPLSN